MGRKRSILIVDDDADASQITKMILEKKGLYDVSVCNCGSEAFKIIQNTRPEMVLLDIMMPDADGAEIANQIQKDKSLALTRIVFMTALVSQKEVPNDSVIGRHFFISKPIDGEIFVKKINGFFEIEK